MDTIVLLGTLDTKGKENEYVSQTLKKAGCEVILIDVGIIDPPQVCGDISREEVAKAAGTNLDTLISRNDRGYAIEMMANGAAKLVSKLYEEKRLDGILALGGSGGTSIASQAMRALPLGVPKLIVSTVASGNVKTYVGQSDITLMYSVVDIAGINSISKKILSNAANAMSGMVKTKSIIYQSNSKKLIAMSMFGVTTKCVTTAKTYLEKKGYEIVIFHANGSGGLAMEKLMKDNLIHACLDITTTELADEVVGGALSAGPERLEMAGKLGLPQVVSLGALDMVNFGQVDTIPEKFQSRKFYKHNPNVTLMRTSIKECASLGRLIAQKLNRANGPLSVFVPLGGLSSISKKGEVFHDPEADRALIAQLKDNLDSNISLKIIDTDINDPAFAEAMANELDNLIKNNEVQNI